MSTFGKYFRVTTFGESHAKSVGVIIDAPPPGLQLNESDIQVQLTRRRPGQSDLSTPRNEYDQVQIMAGTEAGVTLGTPLCLMVWNKDQRPHDYQGALDSEKIGMESIPRPSHADLTYLEKYGVKSSSGGGRSSARETIGRVAAGAVAEVYLKLLGIDIVAFVSSVGDVSVPQNYIDQVVNCRDKTSPNYLSRDTVDKNDTRCPDNSTSEKIRDLILKQKANQDSVGGTIICVIRNVPPGLGEPAFDKMEAQLAHSMMSIPSTKAFEIGSGFDGSRQFGSIHNDPFVREPNDTGRQGRQELNGQRIATESNRSGGVQGGITNGENIYFKVGFKPPATIAQPQQTCSYLERSYNDQDTVLENKGRHDPCVVNRAVAIVESMAALTLMDMVMAQMSRCALTEWIPNIINNQDKSASEADMNTRKLMTAGLNGKPHPWFKKND